MVHKEESAPIVPLGRVAPDEELPFKVELWHPERNEVERILARTTTASLALAIFKSAKDEHPGKRLTVRKRSELIADTGY